MCRLSYITKRFDAIDEWLPAMELSFGGHGNGIAVGKKTFYKGIDLSVQDTIDVLRKTSAPALWHTRRTSSGCTSDRLCHPFQCRGGWLAHNGHWSEGDRIANAVHVLHGGDRMSDTMLFAALVNKLGGFRAAIKAYNPSGVWLHMKRRSGLLSVWKNGGSLHYSHDLRAWGSEPAEEGHWTSVPDGYYHLGEVPEIKEVKRAEPKTSQPRFWQWNQDNEIAKEFPDTERKRPGWLANLLNGH